MPGIDSLAKVVLHGDGANGGTTFTDSSLTPKTFTASGGAVTSTAQSVFGGASMLFVRATSSFISTTTTLSDFNFGTNSMTVDFRLRLNSVGLQQRVMGDLEINGALFSFVVDIAVGNTISFTMSTAGADYTFTSTTTLSADTWYHIACVRDGASLKLFIDGTLETNSSGDANIGVASVKTIQSTRWAVGCQGDYENSFTDAYIDELRVTNGTARWTANFTPPTAAYSVAAKKSKTYFPGWEAF